MRCIQLGATGFPRDPGTDPCGDQHLLMPNGCRLLADATISQILESEAALPAGLMATYTHYDGFANTPTYTEIVSNNATGHRVLLTDQGSMSDSLAETLRSALPDAYGRLS